jgi:hypothetical protein
MHPSIPIITIGTRTKARSPVRFLSRITRRRENKGTRTDLSNEGTRALSTPEEELGEPEEALKGKQGATASEVGEGALEGTRGKEEAEEADEGTRAPEALKLRAASAGEVVKFASRLLTLVRLRYAPRGVYERREHPPTGLPFGRRGSPHSGGALLVFTSRQRSAPRSP